jgi:hypothetical protein
MSLEVKQMIVKTSIVHRSASSARDEPSYRREPVASEMGKILDACRRMVIEMLMERRER